MAATGKVGSWATAKGAPGGPLQPVLPSRLPSLWLLPEGPRSAPWKHPQRQTRAGAERHLGTWVPRRVRVRAWRLLGPPLRKWCPLGNVSIHRLLAKPVREEETVW